MDNMENADLKWIKKHYGEKFSHLCRELCPTILETEGLLKTILSKHFIPSRELYNDIVCNNLINEFGTYINSFLDTKSSDSVVSLSPEELMDRAGYILYPECQTEADIQKFRHYYYRDTPTPVYKGGQPERYEGEELCTFNGGRLNSCRVWFAVKKNVEEIKRQDFKEPRREDDYGVSVISIQFTKSNPSRLSIKNRYNHSVTNVNPDATYGNNLDNIITGLETAFTNKYGIDLDLNSQKNNFEIPSYVQDANRKFYKYNFEINDIYFCPNNIIIDHGRSISLDKERFILFDNYILDIKSKEIINYVDEAEKNNARVDSFINSIGEIEEIKRIPSEKGLTIQIKPSVGDVVEITFDKHNQIISYTNPNVQSIGDDFLRYNKSLTNIKLPNVQSISNSFLYNNNSLTNIELPNVQSIGNNFLFINRSLANIELPNIQSIGVSFLFYNDSLTNIELPNVQSIGHSFLYNNNLLTNIELPNVEFIDDFFLYHNNLLTKIKFSNTKSIGYSFLYNNNSLTSVELPNVQFIGDGFLANNNSLTNIELPNLKSIGDGFLYINNSLANIELPNAQSIGSSFLYNNNLLTNIKLPNVQSIGSDFLHDNNSLANIELPNVKSIGYSFLYKNKHIKVDDILNDYGKSS